MRRKVGHKDIDIVRYQNVTAAKNGHLYGATAFIISRHFTGNSTRHNKQFLL